MREILLKFLFLISIFLSCAIRLSCSTFWCSLLWQRAKLFAFCTAGISSCVALRGTFDCLTGPLCLCVCLYLCACVCVWHGYFHSIEELILSQLPTGNWQLAAAAADCSFVFCLFTSDVVGGGMWRSEHPNLHPSAYFYDHRILLQCVPRARTDNGSPSKMRPKVKPIKRR